MTARRLIHFHEGPSVTARIDKRASRLHLVDVRKVVGWHWDTGLPDVTRETFNMVVRPEAVSAIRPFVR